MGLGFAAKNIKDDLTKYKTSEVPGCPSFCPGITG